MKVRTTNINELRGAQIDDTLSEAQRELWEEIRKRMPGMRVGMVVGTHHPVLYYADELYARGAFGFNLKSVGDTNSTFYIQGPFISNGRAIGERDRLRSKSAATLARKAKKELRAWTLKDRAGAAKPKADVLAVAKTENEEKIRNVRRDARRLLSASGYSGLTPAFLNALRHVEIPDQNVQHAVRVLIEEYDESIVREEKHKPIYVAVHEHRGVPVYDYFDYENLQVFAEGLPQASMPAELYERLSVLNIMEVNDVVPHVGVKISDFEFVLYPPKPEGQ